MREGKEQKEDSKESKETKQTECPICLAAFRVNQSVFLTDCQHAFCATCLTRCLKTNNQCPLCRQQVKLLRLSQHCLDEKITNYTLLNVRYDRQIFEVEIRRSTKEEQIRRYLADLFYLDPKHVKIVHRGKLLNSAVWASLMSNQSSVPSVPYLQVIGSVPGRQQWKGSDNGYDNGNNNDKKHGTNNKNNSKGGTGCRVC